MAISHCIFRAALPALAVGLSTCCGVWVPAQAQPAAWKQCNTRCLADRDYCADLRRHSDDLDAEVAEQICGLSASEPNRTTYCLVRCQAAVR
jgi:hypothetical protein